MNVVKIFDILLWLQTSGSEMWLSA